MLSTFITSPGTSGTPGPFTAVKVRFRSCLTVWMSISFLYHSGCLLEGLSLISAPRCCSVCRAWCTYRCQEESWESLSVPRLCYSGAQLALWAGRNFCSEPGIARVIVLILCKMRTWVPSGSIDVDEQVFMVSIYIIHDSSRHLSSL